MPRAFGRLPLASVGQLRHLLGMGITCHLGHLTPFIVAAYTRCKANTPWLSASLKG